MNHIKVVFVSLLLLIGFLFLLLTPDLSNTVVEKDPPPIGATSQVQKFRPIKTEEIDKNKDSEEARGIVTGVTHANLNRKGNQPVKENNTQMTVSTKRTEDRTTLRSSHEITHVEFLKVHKAASSTTQSIILRFGLKRNLSFVIPTPTHYISRQKYFFSDVWPPLPKRTDEHKTRKADQEDDKEDNNDDNKYDILSHHMVFNHKKVSQLLHKDSIYVAIVREPFDLFISAAFYYKFPPREYQYLDRLRNETFITDLIRNPEQYEATTMAESMTYNSMAYDFGLESRNVKQAENVSDEMFDEFLKEAANTFHLVMVVEQFEESLVLLKRYLNWSLEDILYAKINTFSSFVKSNTFGVLEITENDTKLFKKRNRFDYGLYNFFKNRLQEQISKEEYFADEVTYFKGILRDVQHFCSNSSAEKVKTDEMLKADPDFSKAKEEGRLAVDKKSADTKETPANDTLEIRKCEMSRSLERRNIRISKNQIDKPKDKEMTSSSAEGMDTKVGELIKAVITTKKLSKHQEIELCELGNLLQNGSLELKIDKLSNILKLMFHDKDIPAAHNSKFLVSKSKWNSQFYVTSSDCEVLSLDIMSLYEVVKHHHLDILIQERFGNNFSVIEAVKYVSTFF